MKALLIVFVLIGFNSFSQFQKPTEVSTRTPYFERKFVVGFAVYVTPVVGVIPDVDVQE